MHYMDMNEAYRCFDGIRGPGSCLSRPTSTPTRHQNGIFELPDICIHCGEGGSSEFLYRQAELENQGKTGGRQCYPICKLCLGAGKKLAFYPKKKTNMTKKRKEDAMNKAAAKAAKS